MFYQFNSLSLLFRGYFTFPYQVHECRDLTGFVGDIPIFLAKPQTYMNLSGESVSERDIFFKLLLKPNILALLTTELVICYHEICTT